MRILAHLSDLHFGREDPAVVEGMVAELHEHRPDLVVVSGDLTQRARAREFRAARAFLDRLPCPWLAVPGNHDVPMYDAVRRFLSPYGRYRRAIDDETSPSYHDGEIAVLGINTARSLTVKNGRISLLQMASLRHRLEGEPASVVKIVVTHHPFLPPEEDPRETLVGRVAQALSAMEEAGVDILLSGHLHLGYAREVQAFHAAVKRSMIALQAGTAVSHRVRGEPNAYNRIVIEPDSVSVEVRQWDGRAFQPALARAWTRRDDVWRLQRA